MLDPFSVDGLPKNPVGKIDRKNSAAWWDNTSPHDI